MTVTHFINELALFEPDGDKNSVRDLFEIGLTFGSDEPFHIWNIKLDRVGIDVRFGDGFNGLGLKRGFPF